MSSSQPAKPNPPRKGMRKGTRSCYECRTRKIRCIFIADAVTCSNCAVRNKACTEQRREILQAAPLETRESLRDRVARLEAIILAAGINVSSASASENAAVSPPIHVDGHLRDITSEAGSACTPESPSLTVASTPTLPVVTVPSPDITSIPNDGDLSQNIDPIVTLFENAIWRQQSSQLTPERISKIGGVGNPVAAKKRIRTCEVLLSDLMSRELLIMMMNATCSWWHTWRALGPWLPAAMGNRQTSTLPDFVLWAFDSSDHPSIIGLALLCIAVCVQQLDARVHQYIIRQLPQSPGALFQEYFEKVDRFIINDSDYGSTEEGIEAIVFASKIYMNLGLNRKCWVLTHQAISYSQLLGFHRPERTATKETEIERHRRNQSWLSLCAGDVYLSLLLGLPYAADGCTIPLTQMIDRNQRGMSLSVTRTEEIQKNVEIAIRELDAAFWNAPASLASGRITRQEYLEQIAVQSWLYQLLVFLHMPLMIHSVADAVFEKHRTACLDACRNLLKLYHTMRSDPFSAFGMIKLIDYQAFVCSALLVLGLLGYGSSVRRAAKPDQDRELIRLTIATLRQASGTVNNTIATQALQGLETLMSLDGQCAHERGSCVNPYARITVPYVGTIIITPGNFYSQSKPQATSLDSQPQLAFTFSHDASHDEAALHALPPGPRFDREMETSDLISTELASIDFDWAGMNVPNFEDDWAWLNELNY